MAFITVEQVLDLLKTELQDHFQDALDTLESEHTVKLNLRAPSKSSYFIANSVETVPDLSTLPAVILMGWNEVIVSPGEQSWDIWDFDIACRMWVSGFDQEKLTRAVYRYAAAVVRIVRLDFLALDSVAEVSDLRTDYSSVSPTEPLYQAFEVSFRARGCRDYAY